MSAAPAEIGREGALERLQAMLRIRQFEDRCAELYGKGFIRGYLHLYNGEEAIGVGVMRALEAGDSVVSTYREHGHALARGVPMNALMAELFGKLAGCSRGRGGSMHIFDVSRGLYGGNAIVGGGIPVAIGLALAHKMRATHFLTACFFGEGAAAEGYFHESLNLAALWKLPVLFLCENNLYAMGTALDRSESQTDIHLKAASYRIPSYAVDGMDVIAVEDAARGAATRVRAGGGPEFLELKTYRFRAHSMFDSQLYRTKEEVEAWRRRGPLIGFTQKFKERGLIGEDDYLRLERAADREVDAAVAFAQEAGWEPVDQLMRFVYAERGAA